MLTERALESIYYKFFLKIINILENMIQYYIVFV